ncbi:alpha-ketoglutarate-dependent taurine dioxygenase [Thermosporothrix hazakensis]|jgi:alpha-ketoglutarate-dependent taurine dioxygenase|uniref:Alpha-ketoglutarate-dependent taurine dioxygenase n=1 Tax=Thermosporothrix hazakensis TaxID=644383 RepID=A0A326U722_THEHA|nr:TauD/TfdA family dioxygenase [Thermosporothrix hazakensis]PZW28421.1 alpha-ketoglutarate-dependent taurine dioxygenase [Thermosporothrix hazakensis]GCE45201.1 hypothetical protein KTH_00700 [Thermosporothrix hazakensis]
MSTSPFKRPGAIKRQRVTVSLEKAVKERYFKEGQTLPLILEPAIEGLDLLEWGKTNKAYIEDQLLKHGGVLFRGFQINPENDFHRFISTLFEELLSYRDRATPRKEVGNGTYTSTEYPADQTIELHNENSYAYSWPSKIAFCCLIEPETGGETPIADSSKVYQRIPVEVRERFERKGVMYVRNFGDGVGLNWQSVFQTEDKAEMEEFCKRSHITVEWKDDHRLRTRQIRPATVVHPKTGARVWFNQSNAFHYTTLEKTIQEALLAEHSEMDLPKNVLFGDGTPISTADLEAIRAAYQQETIAFPWKRGDILLLDNILVAHGRAPFTGTRKVIVSMADAYSWDQVEHSPMTM